MTSVIYNKSSFCSALSIFVILHVPIYKPKELCSLQC